MHRWSDGYSSIGIVILLWVVLSTVPTPVSPSTLLAIIRMLVHFYSCLPLHLLKQYVSLPVNQPILLDPTAGGLQ